MLGVSVSGVLPGLVSGGGWRQPAVWRGVGRDEDELAHDAAEETRTVKTRQLVVF